MISIRRIGCNGCQVEHLGSGQIAIRGNLASANDRALVIAAIKTVAGVTSVSNSCTIETPKV